MQKMIDLLSLDIISLELPIARERALRRAGFNILGDLLGVGWVGLMRAEGVGPTTAKMARAATNNILDQGAQFPPA